MVALYFGSIATKQHAVSVLIDQQQKTSETLLEYVQIIQTYFISPAACYHTKLTI